MNTSEKPILNLIWQKRSSWSEDWIHRLLSCIDYQDIYDGNHEVVMDNAIVIDFSLTSDRANYYRQFRQQGLRVGLWHFADECYGDDYTSYTMVDFVLRNYWTAAFDQPAILQLPLGYRSGLKVSTPTRTVPARKYNWCFIGQTDKTSRPAMMASMDQIEQGYCYSIAAFNAPESLPIAQYQTILEDSIFCPAPMGHANLDTYRVYEALECGGIPIVEQRRGFSYFQQLLGEHPLIEVEHWQQATPVVQELLRDSERLEEKRQQCFDWWQDYQVRLQNTVAEFIRSNNSPSHKTTPISLDRLGIAWRQTELIKHQNQP